MPTLKMPFAPQARNTTGDAILEAAATLDTKPLKGRLAAFAKAHREHAAAEAAVRKAEAKLVAAQAKVGEQDALLDEAIGQLAAALAGDGLPRVNPFRPLGLPAPSAMMNMAQAEEPKVARKLVAAVRRRAGLTKATLAAAAKVEKGAGAVEAALAPIAELTKQFQGAIARRETLAMPWEKAFSALKRGARAAEDEGSQGLFEGLFQRPAAVVAPRRGRAKGPEVKPA